MELGTCKLNSVINQPVRGSLDSIGVQADGRILVGGFFTNIGGQTRNYIARLDALTGAADSWNPTANNLVLSIVVQADGKILAGGGFSGANSIGGQTRNFFARLNNDTVAVQNLRRRPPPLPGRSAAPARNSRALPSSLRPIV